MEKYMGIKLISAEPAWRVTTDYGLCGIETEIVPYNESISADATKVEDGYKVAYKDGYVSWSPKKEFESAYMKIIPNPNLTNTDISISQEMVDSFIKETHVSTIGLKTTIVRVVLVNGFEIIETSSCVDAENYSEEIGKKICLDNIKDKIWMLLGFLLQTAVGGVK